MDTGILELPPIGNINKIMIFFSDHFHGIFIVSFLEGIYMAQAFGNVVGSAVQGPPGDINDYKNFWFHVNKICYNPAKVNGCSRGSKLLLYYRS